MYVHTTHHIQIVQNYSFKNAIKRNLTSTAQYFILIKIIARLVSSLHSY